MSDVVTILGFIIGIIGLIATLVGTYLKQFAMGIVDKHNRYVLPY